MLYYLMVCHLKEQGLLVVILSVFNIMQTKAKLILFLYCILMLAFATKFCSLVFKVDAVDQK
jgi:hypothetical protein